MRKKLHVRKKITALKMAMMGFLIISGLSVSAQLSESFDNTSLPAGWTNTNSSGSTSANAFWKFTGNPGYAMSGTLDHTGNGGSYAWVDGSTPSGLTSILTSPTFSMTGTVNPELRFWYKSNITGYTTTFNTLTVDIYDGATWNLAAFTFAANTANSDWQQMSVPMAGYTFTGPAQVRWNLNQNGSTAFYNDVTLDDIEIVSILSNDAGATALLNPVLPGCSLDSTVVVEIESFGATNLTSATINWSVNGTLQAPYSWSGNIAQGATDTAMLSMNSGVAFGDTIDVWTSMPNGIIDSASANDSVQLIYIAGYSGVKVIDPSGAGDFVSFNDALIKLDLYGVCGDLVVEAVNGTYVEQLDITNYTGMSSTNTVTFRSQSGDADSVIISHASTGNADNFVVNFDGASYFSFENLTLQNLGTSYQRVITTPTSGGNTYISFDGCVITATTTNSTSTLRTLSYIYGGGNDNWTLTNNTFHGGSYGLYFYGNFSFKAKNNVVENNEFVNQYFRAAYYYYQEDGVFSNNHVISNSTYTSGYALYLGQCVRVDVDANHVEGNLVWPRYGLYLVTMTGDLNTFMPVTNNRVVMPRPSASYGMYASNCLFVELAHNSVYMNSTSNFSPALYFTGGSFNKVKNNILINGGSGSAMYVSGSGIYEMDYNNFSAPNGVIGYNGSAQATLADWQLATGFDSNSLNINNVMSDTATFKVCNDSLWGVGTYLPAYAMDFEGDMRQSTPCIGADEFLPISQFGFTQNPVLCNGDTLVLMQGYYDTVVWNTTDTTNTYSIVAPGTQTVSVYDACGSDTSVFNVDAQVMASVADTNLCEGTTADLETGISGGTYMWSDGSTDSTINVSAAGTVSVQVVDAYGCESADTAVVTASFDVVLPDSNTFCEGSSVVLDANMTGTYAWSNGSSNQTLAVSASGSYSVTVTDQNCISTATSNVTEILDAVPSFTDSSDHFTVVFTNTSMNATSYLWDFGDGTTSTAVNPTHIYPWTNLDSMNYTVTLTAINSCGDVDAVNDGVRAGQLVSVSELELAHMVSVYPNPNNGLFTVAVKTDDTQEMSVEVMDVRGSLVFAQTYGQVTGEVNREVNMANAAQGIYFVKVTLGGETVVYRVSVQ